MTLIARLMHLQAACQRLAVLLLFGMLLLWHPAYGKTAGVYLVGLGPGDPDLATVKAMRLIEEADIIYSLSKDIRERFAAYLKGKDYRELSESVTRHHARIAKTKAGKAKSVTVSKSDIGRESLVVEVRQAVAQGKQVVFVDSGDPLIFGPWVWMFEEFKDVHLEVVPGISSFNAGLAALKRDGTWASQTHSIILTTDRPQSQDRLEALAAHRCTMAIFTHRTDFAEIIRKLKMHYASETPIAVVFYAGYKDKQSIISGNLDTIESKIKPESLPLEHIIFVGDFLTFHLNEN
ncbi:MAG: hypothetical protein JXA73_14100 [Acidobacteria bacterium]|nr:hypothetical protein [Acidobacteriota bacterium]